jgi:hypothetical protein
MTGNFPHGNAPRSTDAAVIAATRAWIERAVIGLNLCPFAKAVYVADQIRYVVSNAGTADELLDNLQRELRLLAEASVDAIDTTLLIHPAALVDFLDYNDFIPVADAAVKLLELEGTLQIATFHPRYQFSGTTAEDVTNNTNRSPYPMLQLLREASVHRAVATFPNGDEIYRRNIETMRRLGAAGWRALRGQ